jgi:hypothetical protein
MSRTTSPHFRWLRSCVAVAALTLGVGLGLGSFSPGRAYAAPTADPVLCAGKVQADFNGDGFGDLVYPGGADGLSQASPQRFTAADLGLPDDPRGQLSLRLSAAGSR